MKAPFVIGVLLMILIVIGCSEESITATNNFFDYTPPTVVSISPGDESTGVDVTRDIVIKFSEAVNKESAEKAFSITSSGNTDGRFTWDNDRKMVYRPIYGWTPGERYTITLERSLQDINRNSLQRKFTSYFYIGTDFEHPTILDYSGNPYVQENDVVITLYFSKPMDFQVLKGALSFSSSFNYRMTLNDATTDSYEPGTILSIIAGEPLDARGTYTLTISEGAQSITGLPLLREFTYDFAMFEDIKRPEIISVERGVNIDVSDFSFDIREALYDDTSSDTPNYVLKHDALIITFSEAMKRETVENAFSITPDISPAFYWIADVSSDSTSDILIICPDENGFTQEDTYAFFFDGTMEDTVGNIINEKTNTYRLQLSTNAPLINRVVFNPGDPVNEVLIPGSGPDPVMLADYNSVVEDVNIDNIVASSTEGELLISIVFEEPTMFSRLDYMSLYSKVSLTHNMGTTSSDPTIVSYSINEVEHTLEIRAVNLHYSNDPEYIDNIYELTIMGGKDGVKDHDGNYMEDTVRLFFRVTGEF